MKKNLNKQFPLTLTFPFMLSLALTLTLALVSCSDDDFATSTTVTDPLDEQGAVTGMMANVAEFEEGVGDSDAPMSKSQLYYDRVAGKLKFNWTKPEAGDIEDPEVLEIYKANVDHIGIYAEGNPGTQMDFMLDPNADLDVQETYVVGTFTPSDGSVSMITGGTKYYSYFPYRGVGEFTYNNVPISYRGQTQAANEKMGLYLANKTNPDAAFLISEKAAAAHLSGYEYMVAEAIATAGNHVHFSYSHVGSIVRFYMVCPSAADDNIFYDSIQVYNSQANFTREATVNLTTKVVTPTATSHVMSLGFRPAIDMTCNNKHTTGTEYEQEISKYWKTDGSRGYIMAYMMVAPINLKELTESSTLYFIGRQASYYTYSEYLAAKGKTEEQVTEEQFNALPKIDRMKIYENVDDYNDAKLTSLDDTAFDALSPVDKMKDYERKVYKATLSKLNFEAGKHHQWSVSASEIDEPITFQEITIQEWEEGTGFTNTDGVGTEDW